MQKMVEWISVCSMDPKSSDPIPSAFLIGQHDIRKEKERPRGGARRTHPFDAADTSHRLGTVHRARAE